MEVASLRCFCSIMFFSRRWGLSLYFFKPRHHHLLVKLRALVQKCLLLKVGYREEVGPSFGCCPTIFECNLDKTIIKEILAAC